jgi:hypothetical protein
MNTEIPSMHIGITFGVLADMEGDLTAAFERHPSLSGDWEAGSIYGQIMEKAARLDRLGADLDRLADAG